ncbi:MAG: hypothetical protein MZW92_81780 [Comamonadaceae bacterium]|nr:hypothetical protein [Comamonadaceae bacterium]
MSLITSLVGYLGLLWFVVPRHRQQRAAGLIARVRAHRLAWAIRPRPDPEPVPASCANGRADRHERHGRAPAAIVRRPVGLRADRRRRDFSFMGGFLMVGILVAFLAGLCAGDAFFARCRRWRWRCRRCSCC